MIAYIIRRLLVVPIIMLALSIIVFSLLYSLGPNKRLALYVSSAQQLKGGQEQIQALQHKYGLDLPFIVQYWRWLDGALHGDLGWSQWARMPVTKAILHYIPASAELVLYAIIPIVFGGIWLGVLSSVHQDKPIDHVTRVAAIVGWAFPSFVLGLVILLIFYGLLGWFPPGRLSDWANFVVNSASFHRYTGLNTIDGILNGRWDVTWDALRHIIGPVISLSALEWAILLRTMRTSMLEVLRQDYIQTARAKGLAEKVVINKHARRNALTSTLTVAGLLVAGLFTGGTITETVFNYRGLGYYFAWAAMQLDYNAILGTALFVSFIVVIANLVVDLLYAAVDPRVRLE